MDSGCVRQHGGADIDPGQLSRIENDKDGLTIDSLYRLAIVLGT